MSEIDWSGTLGAKCKANPLDISDEWRSLAKQERAERLKWEWIARRGLDPEELERIERSWQHKQEACCT